jgi:hypothetical protein
MIQQWTRAVEDKTYKMILSYDLPIFLKYHLNIESMSLAVSTLHFVAASNNNI